MTGNLIVAGDFVTAASVEEIRAALAAVPAPAAPPSRPPTDEREAELRRALEEALLRPSSTTSEVLLAAHKLAKHRNDAGTVEWIEREMDGYDGDTAERLPREETSHRFLDGYFMANLGGAEIMPFDLRLFESKGVARLEEIVRELSPSANPPSTRIPLPEEIRAFFEGRGFVAPPTVQFFTGVEQFSKILTAIRGRVLRYLRSLS